MAGKLTIHEKAGFLRDSVFSANDGVITTFAIIAGSTGASLSSNIVVVLGLVNLLADGISMASGNYLGVKSEHDYEEASGDNEHNEGSPLVHGFVTFLAFTFVGFLPLIPYVFDTGSKFFLSALIVGLTLFAVGLAKGRLTKQSWIRSGFEMLLVGGLAASAAYTVGFLADKYLL